MGSGFQTFKTKAFSRFAKREALEDPALCEAVRRAREGLIDADLGGGVIKQRVARKGGGLSGGFRTIVLYRRGVLAFFVYGFAKSDRANLRRDELATFRLLSEEYLTLDRKALEAAQAVGAIIEVTCDDQAIQE
ncbi:MAG: type II toxin-antitoxin system RelE/ParE family toxin [Rhodospirillaceae bacterium]|nr:type II toxin-antitoxin system RelE/ParE family toxin [Rhodospirillaceae bacterium]MDD9999379.1 type II toxin-antitoxin system RelE/ParE family toxin [Rhodospirillaceae bacterium]